MALNTSDGTESYQIANKIIKTFGMKKAEKKVFPIIASDIDETMIREHAQQGKVVFFTFRCI